MPCSSEIHVGSVLDVLPTLADGSVHCCVTSPPYWGLRDYGTASWEGGDEGCDHVDPSATKVFGNPEFNEGRPSREKTKTASFRTTCSKCGARLIDSQLGLEPTPEAYVENMVRVFREVRRVLRDDGTLWLNLGDSYNQGAKGAAGGVDPKNGARRFGVRPTEKGIPGLKPKDLVGIPWRVARALQEPYYTGSIRSEADRVWLAAMIDGEGCIFIHKRKAGQKNGQGYVRKNDSYGSGLEVSNTSRAIVERCMEIVGKGSICTQEGGTFGRKQTLYRWNLRSNECRGVLSEVYPHLVGKRHEARLAIGCPSSGPDAEKAHVSLKGLHNGEAPSIDFAEPPTLFEPGWFLRSDIIWSKCNPMPESVTDRPTKAHEYVFLLTKSARYAYDADAVKEASTTTNGVTARTPNHQPGGRSGFSATVPWNDTSSGRNARTVWTIATQPYAEAHFAVMPPALAKRCVLAGCPKGGTVLDPFTGAGTTGLVAVENGCSFVGTELNPEYAELARRRIAPALAQGVLF